jgi:hypothetical protein
MAERTTPPPRRRRRATTETTRPSEPRDFKSRLASARTIAEATDDGYREIERDDRLDFCDVPMILERWEITRADNTYNKKTHCRVWAVVQVPDKPDPVFIKFRDMGGTLGDQLVEMERASRTFGDVAVMLDAREFTFGIGGMDVGYEYSFRDIPADDADIPPVQTEEPTTDEPPY